ncbi:uncharacterized protein LOC122261893 isoform X2 [Penaeus japonicus]|uniref:uncharacterized protein LOC122261893 isoform X2 n=1 Tax=Penaeus japonicus TaxID=27405 RepID=UPI001C70F149|nr:uncharacterized protein LOC122261893 isoform X2 [Penaeus japonicus]
MPVSDRETLAITSPEYPDYSDAVVCQWRLAVAPPLRAAQFALNFSYFRLPNRDDRGMCSRSVLEVDEVPDDARNYVSRSVMSMCGGGIPEPLVVTARAIILRFSSGIFYPRPSDGIGGFKLTVQTRPAELPPPPITTLKVGEILTIILAIILVLTISCFVCYVVKRHRLERRWILQREVMQQRLASHQRPCHEANLTSMLTSFELTRQRGWTGPLGGGRGSLRPRPPLPTDKEPPGAPRGTYHPYRSHLPATLPSPPPGPQGEDENELPLYMELEQLAKKDSGVCFMEQSVCNTPSEGNPPAHFTSSDSCSSSPPSCQACVSPSQVIASCQARRKPPRQTSTNFLHPTSNTASPTYVCVSTLKGPPASAEVGETKASRANGSTSSGSKCHRPRGLSLSSSLYPKVPTTPSPTDERMLTSLSSSSSRRRRHRSSHMENNNGRPSHNNSQWTSAPSLTPCLLPASRNLMVLSHGKTGGEETSGGMRSQISSSSISAFARCDLHPCSKAFVESATRRTDAPHGVEKKPSRAESKSCEELRQGESSLESVFFSGDLVSRPWQRLAVGSGHARTSEGLGYSAHIRHAPRTQLSKSCGDVSPPTDFKQPWASGDIHRSEPSLPWETLAASASRVGPALRRVSEIFVGSNPFLTPPRQAPATSSRPLKEREGGKGNMRTPHSALRSCLASATHGFAPFRYSRLGWNEMDDEPNSVQGTAAAANPEHSLGSDGVARF